jgi:salicylate hydroxylase
VPISHVAIVGAGVAGLTAALALARHGFTCDIFEQADALTEVGAGLQVSPNASRILGELGILDALCAVWLEPREIRLVSGLSLARIATVPCGDFARQRWGAPYGTVHRATLQAILLAAVEANPLCALHLGQRIEVPTPAVLEARSGRKPGLIIGADGVWSRARASVPGGPAPHFSGNVAWRFTIPERQGPAILDRRSVTAFLGSKAHLVCYPLKENSAFNIVAIAPGASAAQGWDGAGNDADRALLKERFSGWHPALGGLLELEENPTFWPLYETDEGRWHNGSDVVLIGDAAHAMMPFAAQGAAAAIEDAFELAGAIASQPLPAALDAFEKHRAPRMARLRKRAAFNRFAYHARGPFRLGRDLLLSMRTPQSLAADFDWIYGYRALG